MNELTEADVRRIAGLARLTLSDAEVVRYQGELRKILGHFEALAKAALPADLQGGDRSTLLAKQAAGAGELQSRMRPDTPLELLPTARFLEQAPDREGVFVRVPAILDRST